MRGSPTLLPFHGKRTELEHEIKSEMLI